MSKIKSIPFLELKNKVIFPNFSLKVTLDANKLTKNFIKHLSKEEAKIIVSPFYLEEEEFFGTLVEVTDFLEKKEKIIITIKGLERVTILGLKEKRSYVEAEYQVNEVINENSEEAKKLITQTKQFFLNNTSYKNLNFEDDPLINSSNSTFADAIVMIIKMDEEDKIELLKESDVEKRLKLIYEILEFNFNEITNINKGIENKVREKFSKQQKEFYLREQMKVIKDEIDELTGESNEIKGLTERVNKNPYPKSVKEKALKEIKRLEHTPSSAPEASIIRTYLDWLLNIPYWQKSKLDNDFKKTAKILDEDHYGLKKPKERVLEHLAVLENNSEAKGQILAFVGPPGTGKTSLSKSIAKSLGREFIKISLGGVKDESEIRGHRRTYIASLPGKIIQAMRKAKVTNPVILLDEIDKMSSDFRGDPASAMLEVLDPEQNNKFQDNFIEEEYDLSNVMFIATANYINDVPEPLYDRLEFIELSSYTELEKVEIAKKYLIKRVLDETKLDSSRFVFTDEAIMFLVRHYTMEAGVRQLQRALFAIARKILVKELKKQKINFEEITPKVIEEFLGPIKFDFTKKSKHPQVGVTNGLAWTSYGGDILPIEVTKYKGKGSISVTGQLRDVMKESSEIAFSYVKANYEKFGIKLEEDEIKNIFEEYDVHIHSPDGSTPKDGPSAGVTFTTSLISLFLKRPVPSTIGMTGEITLTGKVLPIGGLREKSISAARSGLKLIFVPKENEKDLKDIPKEVKKKLKIVLVEQYMEIFNYLKENEKELL